MKTDRATLEFIYAPVQEQLAQVEEKFHLLVSQGHPVLKALLEHVTGTAGKRVRPAISLLASRFHPCPPDLPVTLGAAVELLHVASLVHDDLVDKAAVRRGQATVSSLWGNDIAVMLGDYVFAASAVFVCETGNIRVIRRFSDTIRELATGQIMEAFGAFRWDHTLEQYKERIYNKTASLFRTAAEGGAMLSGASEQIVHLLGQYGHNLGMAFQVVDDILDYEGTEEEAGKPVGHDLLEGRLTLPGMLLVQRYPADNPVVRMFRGEDPDANRHRVLEMVRNSTVIDDSYAVARAFSDDARRALLQIPDTRERQSLLELTSYVLERRR